MNDATPYVIANLKANKTWEEMVTWLDQIAKVGETFTGTVIVCPSSPFLAATFQKVGSSKLKIGAQDVSKFGQGAYTGDFAATQIQSICQYAIIGHSERRQNFNENDDTLKLKTQNAHSANLQPIFCIQSEETIIPDGVKIVAYEPVFAIGTGNPDTPENAKTVAKNLKGRGDYAVIYGGSVTGENVKSYLQQGTLDGVLIGATNSLDPQNFIKVLNSATF